MIGRMPRGVNGEEPRLAGPERLAILERLPGPAAADDHPRPSPGERRRARRMVHVAVRDEDEIQGGTVQRLSDRIEMGRVPDTRIDQHGW